MVGFGGKVLALTIVCLENCLSQIKYLPGYNLSHINSLKLRRMGVGEGGKLEDMVAHLPSARACPAGGAQGIRTYLS